MYTLYTLKYMYYISLYIISVSQSQCITKNRQVLAGNLPPTWTTGHMAPGCFQEPKVEHHLGPQGLAKANDLSYLIQRCCQLPVDSNVILCYGESPASVGLTLGNSSFGFAQLDEFLGAKCLDKNRFQIARLNPSSLRQELVCHLLHISGLQPAKANLTSSLYSCFILFPSCGMVQTPNL